jgi:hypothetical protein
MRADHDGLGIGRCGVDRDFDITDLLAAGGEFLWRGLIARSSERALDIACGFFKLVVIVDIVLACRDGRDP